MAQTDLKQCIQKDMIECMKTKQKSRLATIRLLQAAIKQKEVDERATLSDTDVLSIIEKMIKQRKESARQYTEADRLELAEQETTEITHLQAYLPEPLSPEEISQCVDDAIAESGASSLKDMGALMAALKQRLQGRADMSAVSTLVKQRLS